MEACTLARSNLDEENKVFGRSSPLSSEAVPKLVVLIITATVKINALCPFTRL